MKREFWLVEIFLILEISNFFIFVQGAMGAPLTFEKSESSVSCKKTVYIREDEIWCY